MSTLRPVVALKIEREQGLRAGEPALIVGYRRFKRHLEKWRSLLQICVAIGLSVLLPLLVYRAAGRTGHDIANLSYVMIVSVLVLNAVLLSVEVCLGVRNDRVENEQLDIIYPAATAIIVAYLPNETKTLIETIDSFIHLEYPSKLQIIVAYNTPRFLPFEDELQSIARKYPQLELLRVTGSTSKAENVNAAAFKASGMFVGIFDADHHPGPQSFVQAWRRLARGYDVVQGRCTIRNGSASWVARMVAIEFETLYAISHPGRARLHDFGLFGGSNGFWMTSLLRHTLMADNMLTEDIDATMRVLQRGGKIAFDRAIISYELAPESLRALWNQRMRWAQGWFQVTLKHLAPTLSARRLTVRQKLGVACLLAWSAVFPWLTCQVLPLLLYWICWSGVHLQWFMPVFVFTTLISLSTVPFQVLSAYRLATPELRCHKWWFAIYIPVAIVFYSALKSLISQVAHVKESCCERRWMVTPR